MGKGNLGNWGGIGSKYPGITMIRQGKREEYSMFFALVFFFPYPTCKNDWMNGRKI